MFLYYKVYQNEDMFATDHASNHVYFGAYFYVTHFCLDHVMHCYAVPSSCASHSMSCRGNLNEHAWITSPSSFGRRQLAGLSHDAKSKRAVSPLRWGPNCLQRWSQQVTLNTLLRRRLELSKWNPGTTKSTS